MWGILGIVEYQVDKGAGHKYLRQRISAGDWIGIGFDEKTADEKRLLVVPKIPDAKHCADAMRRQRCLSRPFVVGDFRGQGAEHVAQEAEHQRGRVDRQR
jgi:hypothetical protein